MFTLFVTIERSDTANSGSAAINIIITAFLHLIYMYKLINYFNYQNAIYFLNSLYRLFYKTTIFLFSVFYYNSTTFCLNPLFQKVE